MSSKTLQATWIVSDNSNADISVLNNVKQTQQRLPTELGLPLKVFDDVTDCTIALGYSSSITEKTILILDANVAQEALHLLHNLCHIVCIFVYWMDFDENLSNSLEQLRSKYNKMVVLDFDHLLKRVQAFSERWQRHAADFFSFATLYIGRLNRSSTNINSSFLFSQLLVDLLLHMKPLETDRVDFCTHCTKKYEEIYEIDQNEAYFKNVLEQIRKFQ
ncbi:unnamed protein product, partial [Adineta ricciae]